MTHSRMTGRPGRAALLAATALGAALASGCDSSEPSSSPPIPLLNIPPTVSAGEDQVVASGTTVTLTGVVDDEDDVPAIAWSQLSGPPAALSDTAALTTSFEAMLANGLDVQLEFALTADDGVNTPTVDTVVVTIAASPASIAASDWIVNEDGAENITLLTPTGEPAPVNVQSVALAGGFGVVTTHSIPDYQIVVTQDVLDRFSQRPNFDDDLPGGVTVALGDTVSLGDDLGYSGLSCAPGQGAGFWPPNNYCPVAVPRQIALPLATTPAVDACATDLGLIGVFLNGVGLFNWSDGRTHDNGGVWRHATLAVEAFDLDVCEGHVSQGVYHHHGYSACLAAQLGDDGSGPSPIYGFAADGYPIYGPWEDAGVLARSCWRKRDYAADSPTGCGADDARTCQLVDPADPGAGVVAVADGPRTDETLFAPVSQQPIVAAPGAFAEDYWFDADCAGEPEGLDIHNGHSRGSIGYHYHVTVDAEMNPTFPYAVGPTYAGVPPQGSAGVCAAP